MLTGCTLLPLSKPNNGIRPLALGSVFTRIAGKIGLSLVEGAKGFETIFPSIQLGIGSNGGPEVALQTIQTYIDTHADHCVLSIDVKNAFNTVSRPLTASALYAAPVAAPLYRLFDFLHRTPSALYVYGQSQPSNIIAQSASSPVSPPLHFTFTSPIITSETHKPTLLAEISSRTGVKQGDPGAGFYFAASLQADYEATQAAHPTTTLVAIHDDLHIMGTAHECMNAFKTYQHRLQRRGDLTLEPTKSALLIPNPTTDNIIRDFNNICHVAASLSIPIVTNSMKCLGGAVGTDDAFISDYVDSVVDSYTPLFAAIQHEAMSVQISYHLLRSCLHPRLNYLMRTMKPNLITHACSKFDDNVLNALKQKMKINTITEQQEEQIRLPCRLGGIGLAKTQDIAPVAFYACYSLSLPILHRSHLLLTPSHPLLSTLHRCHASLFECGVTASADRIPADFDVAVQLYISSKPSRNKLQHYLFSQVQNKRYDDLLTSIDAHDERQAVHRAMLVSASADKSCSSVWLTQAPTEWEYVLSDIEFNLAVRNRLALLPSAALETTATDTHTIHVTCQRCQQVCISPSQLFSHAHTCKPAQGREVTHRHNLIVQSVLTVMRGIGWVTTLEQVQQDSEGHRLRPDARCYTVYGDVGTRFIDVAISHPANPSYLYTYSHRQGALLKRREKEKHVKYADIMRTEGAVLSVCAMETTNTYSEQFSELLRIMAAEAVEQRIVTRADEFVQEARAAISAASVRGNALVTLAYLGTIKIRQVTQAATTRTPRRNSIVVQAL